MSVRLFGHWTCPYVTRVDFALGRRGVDFDLANLPPSAVRSEGFVLPDEFATHSHPASASASIEHSRPRSTGTTVAGV